MKIGLLACCSVTESCLTLHYPMECNTPGFPVPHHLPESAQVHVHCQELYLLSVQCIVLIYTYIIK